MSYTIVFGATGGIGTRLCEILTQQKKRILIAGRNEKKTSLLAQRLNQDYHIVDLSSSATVHSAIEQIRAKYGDFDNVVNCIGSLFLKPLEQTTDEEWKTVLTCNLTNAFYILKAACPVLARQKKGSIVLLASAAAQIGLINHEAIGAAKAGLVGLMRCAAASYASSGVRINVIAPGLVQTPLTQSITANAVSLKNSISMHPLGRIGAPDDIAHTIAWLLDEHSSWITGQVITVDGGLSSLKMRSTS
ncbi:MAG: SDR family oxidoreductase [Verrucomicrobia bacterium]|nr:SDR family oxidoreductase [Verrucomicrobiota bacterium]